MADTNNQYPGNRTEVVAGSDKLGVALNRTETVGANETITIGGNRTESVGASAQLSVGASLTASAARQLGLSAGQTLRLEAAETIELVVGAARLVLRKDGTIEISGRDILLNASGRINAKAAGEVQIRGSKVLQN